MNKILFGITLSLLVGHATIAQKNDALTGNIPANASGYDTIPKTGYDKKYLRDSLRNKYPNWKSDGLRNRNRRSDSFRYQYRKSDSLRNQYRKSDSFNNRSHYRKSDSLRNRFRNSDSLRNQYRKSDSLNNQYRKQRFDSLYSKRLQQALNLTPEQEVTINNINKNFRQKAYSISRDTTLTVESRKSARQALMLERKSQFTAALTAEQQTKYAEMQKQLTIERQQRTIKRQQVIIRKQHEIIRKQRRAIERQRQMAGTHRKMKNPSTNVRHRKMPMTDQKEKATKQQSGKRDDKINQLKDSSSTASLQNTYWKLSEINNKPVVTPENAREIHIMFANDGKSFKGFAGCNGLGGNYTVGDKQTITINAISTKMYCDRMEAENFLTNAISKANRYVIKGERLFLYENKKVLASFNSVYF